MKFKVRRHPSQPLLRIRINNGLKFVDVLVSENLTWKELLFEARKLKKEYEWYLK